jgi:hypothetical protein
VSKERHNVCDPVVHRSPSRRWIRNHPDDDQNYYDPANDLRCQAVRLLARLKGSLIGRCPAGPKRLLWLLTDFCADPGVGIIEFLGGALAAAHVRSRCRQLWPWPPGPPPQEREQSISWNAVFCGDVKVRQSDDLTWRAEPRATLQERWEASLPQSGMGGVAARGETPVQAADLLVQGWS